MAWALGVVGVAVSGLGAFLHARAFYFGWLAALSVWIGWPLGSLSLLLIHRLTGGRWGDALRPYLRAGTATLPLLLPAILPVLIGLPVLYAWARPEQAPHLANSFYLNVPFFLGRGAAYLILWLGLAAFALFTSPANTRVAAIGLPLLALTFTFAIIDLTMSLDPAFNSSVYGMLQGAGAVLFALSLAVVPAAWTAKRDAVADLGKLLLALVVLWAYLDFMQFLIVWESNLSHDAGWYQARMSGGWAWAFTAQAAFHFALPFGLLIVPGIQRNRAAMAAIAVLLAFMAALRGWWTVLPAGQRPVGWIELACMCGMLGCGAGLAASLGRTQLVQRHV
ncbi:MAG: hypothetical protein JOZ42_12010 [Acetobacteraceae bacterium]|nr:hypothetical protein [Acetobacteraceae bacterium]